MWLKLTILPVIHHTLPWATSLFFSKCGWGQGTNWKTRGVRISVLRDLFPLPFLQGFFYAISNDVHCGQWGEDTWNAQCFPKKMLCYSCFTTKVVIDYTTKKVWNNNKKNRGSRGRGYMFIYGCIALFYGRKQHITVKQFSSN